MSSHIATIIRSIYKQKCGFAKTHLCRVTCATYYSFMASDVWFVVAVSSLDYTRLFGHRRLLREIAAAGFTISKSMSNVIQCISCGYSSGDFTLQLSISSYTTRDRSLAPWSMTAQGLQHEVRGWVTEWEEGRATAWKLGCWKHQEQLKHYTRITAPLLRVQCDTTNLATPNSH